MKSEEMFAGFSVRAGEDRFDEHIKINGEPNDCKVSAQDTDGAMCVFEFNGTGWPRHLHHDQDEWIYILKGELHFEVGNKRFRAGTGESVFIPRKVSHVWASVNDKPAKIINTYQPAGKMEEFFRELSKFTTPQIHEVLSLNEFSQFFQDHGMELLGPPLVGEWEVSTNPDVAPAGRLVRAQ